MLAAAWRRRGPVACALWPLAALFALLVALRRLLYRSGLRRGQRIGVPVVVVGNLIAGGAGKTPLVMHLCHSLARAGRRPGVVSRGHGGERGAAPHLVRPDDAARVVGDEPLLIRQRTGAPVCVCADRVAAARALRAAHPEIDVVIADDGLQHYALDRDVELVVFDGRGAMNGWPLPAGPLREPLSRLRSVDAVVWNGAAATAAAPRLKFQPPSFVMTLVPGLLRRVGTDERLSAGEFARRHAGRRVHALAGIGAPQRFFDLLAELGIDAVGHALADHHAYRAADLALDADALVVTEKDAVKFSALALPATPVWVLPVDAQLAPDLTAFVLEKLDGRPPA